MNVADAGTWGTRTTFLLALSASTVGMGNIWRFSYLTGEYGGGAFVVTYVGCLVFIAVPVMVAEIVLGKYGGPSPVGAIRRSCDGSLRSRAWQGVGALACLSGLLLLSLYIIVAGWGMAYIGFLRTGVFSAARAVDVGTHFDRFLSDPMPQVYWQSLFLALAAGTVVLGVRRGLGMLVWFTVPLLVGLLAFLIKFGFDNGDIGAAGNFLFSTRVVDFTSQSVLLALGQAFFTLSIGVGTGISYGAYAPQRTPIARSVMAVAVFDTIFAVLTGLAIFPIVFASNVESTSGPGLLFIGLPYAFGNLMQGELAGTAFFVLVVVAALGSAVAIMEPIVATLIRQLRLARFTATLLVAAAVWLLSLAVVLSLGKQIDWIGQRSLLDILDTVTAGVLLPLVSLLIAILVGWRLRPEILRLELARESDLFFSLWCLLLRYIAPPAIVLLVLAHFFSVRL